MTIPAARTAKKARITTAGESAHFLQELHFAHCLFLCGPGQMRYLGQTGNNARNMLDRAERRAEAQRGHERGDPCRLAECRPENSAKLGRFSVPFAFFSRQTGDSGRNGRTAISGIAGRRPDRSV